MTAIATNPTSYRVPVVAGVILTLVVGLTGAKRSELEPLKSNPPEQLDTKSLPQPAKKKLWMQIGQASWYGSLFHGRHTANGEVYDMYGFTCAHPSAPMGSILKVTNLKNQKSILVRVNDRGPIAPDKIIDLSLAGAQALGFVEHGWAKVRIERFEELPTDLKAPTVAQLATPQLQAR